MYTKIVTESQDAFQEMGWLKTAQDLAIFLDSPALKIKLDEKRGGDTFFAAHRQRIFDDFCAICEICKVNLPSLEPELYLVHLPIRKGGEKELAEAGRFSEYIHKIFKGKRDEIAYVCRMLALLLKSFPQMMGDSSSGDLSGKRVIAVVNSKLMSIGLPPYRPDYQSRQLDYPRSFDGPAKLTEILIFDDNIQDIMKTFQALAGWPNLKISFYHYSRERSYQKLQGFDREQALTKAITVLVEQHPGIVLMDQLLGDFRGSELVERYQSDSRHPHILFVGNTGGEADELRAAGVYTNFAKGREKRALSAALSGLTRT